MKTVGLTGGIACGKSTVAGLLRAAGLPVIDADQVSRDVVAPGAPALAEIAARFGPGVLRADGSLDRKALGALVVSDGAARADLEAITHPRIREAIAGALAELSQAGQPVAVVEAALMVETGSWRLYDALLVVAAHRPVQLARLMAREGLDEAAAARWIDTQLPVEEKVRRATAVIWNDDGPEALAEATARAWGQIAARLADQ